MSISGIMPGKVLVEALSTINPPVCDSSQRADFASKMVRPDAIVPIVGEAIHAARQATSTVPIVVSARPARQPGFVGVVRFEPPEILNLR